ncbi:MAG TPA: arylsulfatase, partial [Luteolibacter sp.]|nr:arylsulfatase [Luteolibacter sp.]
KEGQDTSRWGNLPDVQAGPPGTFQSYGTPWANVSNTPLRLYKTKVHEGGVSTPLVAHWPAGIAANRHGALVKDPGHLIDLMATCVEVSGAVYPTSYGKREVRPMEGVSLVPTFKGEALQRRQPIFFEHQGNQALRDGPWKLVRVRKGGWELYNIVEDRCEMLDLSAEQPERVEAMKALWNAWALRADVVQEAATKGGK